MRNTRWLIFAVIMALALGTAAMAIAAQQPEAACCARPESDSAVAEYRLREIAPGQRIRVREAAPSADPQLASGLQVLVLNQQGLPVADASVQAFHPTAGYLRSSRRSGADGRATLNVPDGQWNVSASSPTDHFVVWRGNVTAPGSLTLDTQGTVPVTAIARDLNGQPLVSADASFERFQGYNWVGRTDETGRARADLLPGTYCAAAAGWGQNLYLSRPGVAVGGPMTVTLDPALLGMAQVRIHLLGLTEMGLSPDAPCRGWSPIFDLEEGESAWISAGRWALSLHGEREVAGIRWLYYYDAFDGAEQELVAGSVTTLTFGTPFTATVSSRDPSYAPGSYVYLLGKALDQSGNRLTQISRGPQQEGVLPRLLVVGPGGAILYDGTTYADSWKWLALPFDAAPGVYDVTWTWDTGPLQGVLQATTHFTVGGASLPTPTATKKPLKSLYLPLVLKGH